MSRLSIFVCLFVSLYVFFVYFFFFFFFFFFSSRRRHTRSYGDWSSDVCSSDLLSTLDELGADQARGLRHRARLWIDRRHVVLRHAKVYQGSVSADPAGAVSTRHSRHAAGNGLPLLPQLCGSSGALECPQHADVQELPYAGAKGQPEAGARAGELEDR